MNNINAFVNPVVRGVINPNRTITYKKELHFDSRFRDNYGAPHTSAASFLYNLPQDIDNVVSLRLASISVPSIPITISKSNGNNLFYIDDIPIIIDDGIYNIQQLLVAINDEINDKINPNQLEFSQTTNNVEKTTITNDDINTYKITFYKQENCTNFMSTLGWFLGFRVASISVTTGNSVTSSALFDNNFTDYLYFAVDDFQKNMCNNNIVYLNKTTSNNNILGKIYRSPVSGTYFLNNLNTSTSYEADRGRIYFGPVRLSKLKFSLLDKFTNLVDMNNMDYSFTLEVEVLYDRNNVTIPC